MNQLSISVSVSISQYRAPAKRKSETTLGFAGEQEKVLLLERTLKASLENVTDSVAKISTIHAHVYLKLILFPSALL